jgi:predicted nucleic acid-binding protein
MGLYDMIIVCDSSPLFALAICDKLYLLDRLYDKILLPLTVFRESTVIGKPNAEMIRLWGQDKVVEITDDKLFQAVHFVLDAGEAEAITLYKEKSADALLIDEQKGRKIAEYYNINIIGTLGVLLKAKRASILTEIAPSIRLLRQSKIRISDELYDSILEMAGE